MSSETLQYFSEIYFAHVSVRPSVVAMCSRAVGHTHYLQSFYKHVKSCMSKLITALAKSSKRSESDSRVADSTLRPRPCGLSTVHCSYPQYSKGRLRCYHFWL